MDALELELSVSPDEMCRTCLAAVDRAQLKPIFCSEILDGKIVPFPKVIELTTGEKFVKNEKLPNNVCVQCKAKLRECYIFLEKVRKSSNLLYEIFSVSKPEPPKAEQTKTVAVQTAFTDEGTAEIDQSAAPLIVLVENGTQCDLPMLETFTEESSKPETHSEEKTEAPNKVQTICLNSFSATFEDVEKMSLISIDKEITRNEPMSAETDEGTTYEVDEYDMILVTEEPSEEDCYALSTLKLARKCCNKAQSTVATADQPAEDAIATSSAKKVRVRKYDHCEYCNFKFRFDVSANHFGTHQQSLEMCLEAIDYYRCPTCYKVFISQTHFDAHFKSPCEKVSIEKYTEDSDLKKHEKFYLDGQVDVCVPKLKTFNVEDDLYRCVRCSMQTKIFEEMREHAQSHDAADDQIDINLLSDENGWDQVHVCGLCLAQFPDALYIRQHLYFHQNTFFCPYNCNMSFEKFLNLTKHIQRTHLLETKLAKDLYETNAEAEKFLCGLCGRCFLGEDTLEAHVKRHYRERKHVCTECNKSFSQKGDLITHVRIHTDERPYICEICGKKFRTTSHRRDHMTTHEAVNKFKCNVCHKLFKAQRILAGHKRLHTGEKPFQCNVCDKVFARKHHVKLHSKVHQKAPKRKV